MVKLKLFNFLTLISFFVNIYLVLSETLSDYHKICEKSKCNFECKPDEVCICIDKKEDIYKCVKDESYISLLDKDEENNESSEIANPADPEPVKPKPAKPKPDDPKPAKPKPDDPKPGDPEPVAPKPAKPKPNDPKPAKPKPEDPKPAKPKPDDPKPGDPEPVAPKPAKPKPNDPKPAKPKPNDPKPAKPKPDDPKPAKPKPNDPKPADPEPVAPKPAKPKPDDPKPAKPKPEDPKPADPEPVAPKPKPVEPKPGAHNNNGSKVDDNCNLDCGSDGNCINLNGYMLCKCKENTHTNNPENNFKCEAHCKVNNGGCDPNAKCVADIVTLDNNDTSVNIKCECNNGDKRYNGYYCSYGHYIHFSFFILILLLALIFQ